MKIPLTKRKLNLLVHALNIARLDRIEQLSIMENTELDEDLGNAWYVYYKQEITDLEDLYRELDLLRHTI